MMKTIFTELHLYDEDANYIAFDWEKEDKLLAFQRKFLPSSSGLRQQGFHPSGQLRQHHGPQQLTNSYQFS